MCLNISSLSKDKHQCSFVCICACATRVCGGQRTAVRICSVSSVISWDSNSDPQAEQEVSIPAGLPH